MAKVSPWSVKGVEPEAREAAKIAARRAGMTVGQWLNHTIRVTAAQQLATASRVFQDTVGTEIATGNADPGYSGALHKYNPYQNNRPVLVETGYRAHPPAPTSAPTNAIILENLLSLSDQIERTERKTAATIAPLTDQVEHLSERLELVRSQAIASTAPVERAVQRISERLEKIEATREANVDNGRRSLFSRSK